MCILFVEDEILIRDIMRESLLEAGFEVLDFGNADDAVAAISNRSHEFSVLVTDLHLPGGRDGLAVAEAMRAHYPHVPIVIATGRPDVLGADMLAVDMPGTEASPFRLLAKPYGVRDLVRTVNELRS